MLFACILLFAAAAVPAQEIKPGHEPGTRDAAEIKSAMQLFETEYHPQTFAPYPGDIASSGNTFYYTHGTFRVAGIGKEFWPIFSRGLLNPFVVSALEIFRSGDSLVFGKADTVVLSNLEEFPELSASVKQKRFRFWLLAPRHMNPQVCFFELTNDEADAQTDLTTFILHARLTFYIQAWIVI